MGLDIKRLLTSKLGEPEGMTPNAPAACRRGRELSWRPDARRA